jgi:hypothetical protein
MRFALLLLAGMALAAPLAGGPVQAATGGPVQAATLRPVAVAANADDIVEAARVNCGRRAHYIRGHRARNGQWIKAAAPATGRADHPRYISPIIRQSGTLAVSTTILSAASAHSA